MKPSCSNDVSVYVDYTSISLELTSSLNLDIYLTANQIRTPNNECDSHKGFR